MKMLSLLRLHLHKCVYRLLAVWMCISLIKPNGVRNFVSCHAFSFGLVLGKNPSR